MKMVCCQLKWLHRVYIQDELNNYYAEEESYCYQRAHGRCLLEGDLIFTNLLMEGKERTWCIPCWIMDPLLKGLSI
jgi:hypothetical protein